MNTAPKSTFTFVLSDQLEANEYTFITFRDRDKLNSVNSSPVDSTLIKVRELEDRIAQTQKQSTSKTKYTLDIQVDANPDAEMILVMDPVGGDRIKARGDGKLHLIYDSDNEKTYSSPANIKLKKVNTTLLFKILLSKNLLSTTHHLLHSTETPMPQFWMSRLHTH